MDTVFCISKSTIISHHDAWKTGGREFLFGPQIALEFGMSHESKIVVITGASAGVGRATVREFARNGWSIGLLARGSAGLEAAKAEVEALGGRALIIPADVADHVQVEAAAIAVESNLGPIHIWVNNAMVS